jgi:hypothetical protein
MMVRKDSRGDPLCIIESFFTDISTGSARSMFIVLPAGLVNQSAHMLATELAPYLRVPVGVHYDKNSLPGVGRIGKNDTVVEFVVRARITDRQRQYLFDEVRWSIL